MPSVRIVLGVSGGIAAYKAAEIVRGLARGGADVTVVMTRNARRFITPLTLETLSGRRVITGPFRPSREGPNGEIDVEHIGLARDCDALLVAPATANVLGKLAMGLADDFLSTFYLAVRCPVLIAPAMNPAMWDHPAVTANIRTLRERGVIVIDPEHGPLAGRREGEGVGRLAHPDRIVERALSVVAERDRRSDAECPLAGRTVLVTAGPTRESIDAVRYLSSPSSGRMGFALADEARRAGAKVVLVSGPTDLPDPDGVKVIRVTTAGEMREAVISRLEGVDIVIAAAAVSDFRPARPAGGKIKKEDAPRSIELEPNPDILAEIGAIKGSRFLVGFAAETEDALENARKKLRAKKIDMIVANDVGRGDIGFGSDDNEVTVIDKAGAVESWPRMAKDLVARRLMERIAEKMR